MIGKIEIPNLEMLKEKVEKAKNLIEELEFVLGEINSFELTVKNS